MKINVIVKLIILLFFVVILVGEDRVVLFNEKVL